MQEFAKGLRFPEGPIALGDGSLLVVEVEAGRLTRIDSRGDPIVVAQLGGGPNGAAMGPDGRCYVCNNGGFSWRDRDGVLLPTGTAADYRGGSIQAVDLERGTVEVLYTHCGERMLNGPNDLVFDRSGGFWFTDPGHTHGRIRDRGAIYYAAADGSSIQEVIFPLDMPNGIALSPCEDTLYVAETLTGRVWEWKLEAPGRVVRAQRNILGGTGTLLIGLDGFQLFDSMAMDAAGNLHIGTIPSGISVVSPKGSLLTQVAMPERFATNLCFGGPDRGTMFATLSSTGRVIAAQSAYQGLALNFHK